LNAEARDPPDDFDVGARLRQVREEHDLSQRQLAERADVTHAQISQVERNQVSPSVASLRKILSGIGMTMAQFFEVESAAARKDQVFFAPHELADLTSKLSDQHGVTPHGLLSLRQVGDARRHNLQILHEVYAPGADTGESMLEHEASEGGIIVSGELEVIVGSQSRILKPGDAYLFDSRQPHRFRNLSEYPCTVISACTPPYL
jgi:transcriptional regulator with XRE-family HTH domain